jgi:hypothetical protein
MKRSALNFLIDAIATAIMLGMIATGIIVRFALPPGSGSTKALWRLTRHQWGDLHFWLSLAAVAIVLLHLALHWKWVVSIVRGWIAGSSQGAPSLRLRAMAAVATILIVCGAVLGFWWTAVRSVQPVAASQTNAPEHRAESAGIRGNMSLSETATALGCSVEQVRQRLGLPASVQNSDRLGQIAKERGTTMQGMRQRLESPVATP